MKYFSTGNVIRFKNDTRLSIITNVRSDYINWIPMEYSNASGSTAIKTHTRDSTCYDCDAYEGGDGFDDNGEICKQCNGTGTYKETVYGAEEAEFVASCVKTYIIEALLKNFNF